MEELTETSFFKIASGTDKNGDFESTYKDFTYKIFEMCNVTRINYGALVFTLNHTSIELSSLLEIIADSEVGKKCEYTSLYSKSNIVYREGNMLYP